MAVLPSTAGGDQGLRRRCLGVWPRPDTLSHASRAGATEKVSGSEPDTGEERVLRPPREAGARGGSGRRRTCNPPVKSRKLCLLSYGAGKCGRQGSNLRRPAFQAGALPAELRPRVVGGSPSIHHLEAGRSMQRRETPPSVCRAAETSALFSEPLAHPSTLDRRPPAARARVVAVLRGGALEPDPRAVPKNCSANGTPICNAIDTRTRRAFLSRAGPRSVLVLL